MEVYRIDTGGLDRIEKTEITTEKNLEQYLIQAEGAEIGNVEILYVDQQGSPGEGGIFDIVGVDYQGNVVVIELKRDRTPRDIVAQALEYAASIRAEDYEHLNKRYQEFTNNDDISLRNKHTEFFDRDDPLSEREFNTDQRLLLVGREFNDLSLDMADFLREHGIDVICVSYSAFSDNSDSLRLLTTESIRRPLAKEPSSVSGGSTEINRVYTADILDGDTVLASLEETTQAVLMEKVIEYLIQDHDLLNQIELPCCYPNSVQAIINDKPEHPGEWEMHGYREIEDDLFIHSGVKAPKKRRRLNYLVQECGLDAQIDM